MRVVGERVRTSRWPRSEIEDSWFLMDVRKKEAEIGEMCSLEAGLLSSFFSQVFSKFSCRVLILRH